MRIPETSCIWADKSADELACTKFQMFLTKMEDIQAEFDGSPRKQTKLETLVEGFKHVHNAGAAANLIGRKFIISRSGRPLFVTALPAAILRNFPLPQEYEDELKGKQQQAATPTPNASGAFAGFGKKPAQPANQTQSVFNDEDSRRISFAAKRMFMELGAALEVIYASEEDDLVILEVKKDAKPESMIEAVFSCGEQPDGLDNFPISFGLLKDIQ